VEVGGRGEGEASWLTMEGSAQAVSARRRTKHIRIWFGVLDMDLLLRRKTAESLGNQEHNRSDLDKHKDK
jgi:hypothetical protein